MTETIEKELSSLLEKVDEQTYNTFIKSNNLLHIYDQVAQIENPDNILKKEILEKILTIIKEKKENI